MKREIKILIFLFVMAFIIRGIFVFVMAIPLWDETVYANLGYDLSNNPFDYSVKNNGWSDFIPNLGDDFYAWPKMGFRAPLLPYFLSVFYFVGLGSLIVFVIPIFGALSVLLLYVLGKKLFNKKIGFYSALFFALVPLHVFYSGRILTGVLCTFFILLTSISFWKGYEEENRLHKILFGVFLALALLSRYTVLWIMPVFLFYFLARDKSFKFLKDKYLGYSIFAFFLTLIPWFVYGMFEYNNPIGAFIHGAKASAYWGGLQSWHFFFDYWWKMFSVIGFVFVAGVIYLFYKRDFFKKEIYLLLIWFGFFLGMAIYMPHKEDRFLIPIIPPLCLISGFFVDKLKKHRKFILVSLVIISLLSLSFQFSIDYNNSYTDLNKCFLEGNKFLQNQENSLIITDESPIIYYYSRQETHFYPNPWDYEYLKSLIENHYLDKNSFVFFTDFDMSLDDGEHIWIKEDLDKNLERVFECSREDGYSAIYKYSDSYLSQYKS